MSVPGRLVAHYNIMTAKSTTGIGKVINVRDYRNIVVSIGTASSANLTVKAQGAIGTNPNPYTAPDFSASQSATNMWDYIKMIDLNSGSAVAGDTGFSVTGTDDVKLYEINVNAIDYLSFSVTARSAGTVTIEVMATNNV